MCVCDVCESAVWVTANQQSDEEEVTASTALNTHRCTHTHTTGLVFLVPCSYFCLSTLHRDQVLLLNLNLVLLVDCERTSRRFQEDVTAFVSASSSSPYLLSSRRGSNVSLVLDMSALGSVEPMNVAVVTPREAAAREYLLSANRPLTRQQLHDLVNNTLKLQAEFAVRHKGAL